MASIAQIRDIAEQINRLGPFDAVIHNVAVGYREPRRIQTEDGLPHVFAKGIFGQIRAFPLCVSVLFYAASD